MPPARVILVEPKFGGNIGATARAMANFGFRDLILVNPMDRYDKEDETWKRAVHARPIVEAATVVPTLDEALALVDYAVATTSELPEKERKHRRDFLPLAEAADLLSGFDGTCGLLFGREDYGLFNDEVGKCDLVTTIPTSPDYRSLNLSHAVTVVLYEMSKPRLTRTTPRRAGRLETETLLAHFEALSDAIDLKPHRREQTTMAMRRILGRAMPSRWEYHRVMGVFSRTLKVLKHPAPATPVLYDEESDAAAEDDPTGP